MTNPLQKFLLDTYPAPEVIPAEPEERAAMAERFRIENDDQANWAMRKIGQIRTGKAAAETIARTEILRINTWLEGEKKRVESEEAFFTGLLAAYYVPQHEADKKKKTFKLPAGSLHFRAQQPEFARDDETLVSWLKANAPELVETKETPVWGELKKQLAVVKGQAVHTGTGEVVAGVTVNERGEKISVETE